jgi:NAD(P)-dependent dehydrogenase (short-subunit alcohol dehydrogenase family)
LANYIGKTAIITGGGGGIAHGYALQCLKHGLKLVLADINMGRLVGMKARLMEEIPGSEIEVFEMDCSQQGPNNDLAAFAQKKFGRIDMVFLNAGVHFHKDFTLMTEKDWELIIKCNLLSVICGMRTFLPILESNDEGGNVINTGSGASVSWGATMAHYCAMKHAVMALSASDQREVENRGNGAKVLITCVFPDFVSSNLMDSLPDVRESMGLVNEVEEQTPIDKAMEGYFRTHVAETYAGAPLPDQTAITNETAGEVVWKAIEDRKNFVFTHGGLLSNGAALARQVDSGYLDKLN